MRFKGENKKKWREVEKKLDAMAKPTKEVKNDLTANNDAKKPKKKISCYILASLF